MNMFIGLMQTERTTVWAVKTTNTEMDVQPGCSTRAVHWEGGSVLDHVAETRVVSNCSYRPIHSQIMHTEATRVAQMLWCIKALKVPARCVKCVKTDAVVLQGFAAKYGKHLTDIADRPFEDLPRL